MEKHTISAGKIRFPQIRIAILLQIVAVAATACLIVWAIMGISSGVKAEARREAAHSKADTILRAAQKPEIIIHQPDKLEVYYPETEQEIDGTNWTRKSFRYLIPVKHIARIEYSKSGELYMAIESGRNRHGPTYTKYWFRNLTYEEWNAAVSKLEWKKP